MTGNWPCSARAIHADAIALLPGARLMAVTDVAAAALEIVLAVNESSRTGRPVSLGR